MSRNSNNIKRKVQQEGIRDKRIEVVGNQLVNRFLSSNVPENLKSKVYPYQAILGFTGIILIFISFRKPALFFAGAIILLLRHQWRKKTDGPASHYRNAIISLRKKQYQKCINSLEAIIDHPETPQELRLIIASCYLELNQHNKAFLQYETYFMNLSSQTALSPEYWSSQENAILLALEEKRGDMALHIASLLNESNEAHPNARAWKHYYKGCSQKKLQQLSMAVTSYKDALQEAASASLLQRDVLYQLAECLWMLNHQDEATIYFRRVHKKSPQHRNIQRIIELIDQQNISGVPELFS